MEATRHDKTGRQGSGSGSGSRRTGLVARGSVLLLHEREFGLQLRHEFGLLSHLLAEARALGVRTVERRLRAQEVFARARTVPRVFVELRAQLLGLGVPLVRLQEPVGERERDRTVQDRAEVVSEIGARGGAARCFASTFGSGR